MIGRQWSGGRYRARYLIGRGGAAEVWRATDRLLQRDVAVKAFAGGTTSGGADDEARFRAEVRLMARLDHPHVVPVWDAGISDDAPWYVMQLADGGSLAQCSARWSGPELARVAAQVADALAYLHSAQILHRDVKPSNILLDGEGEAYLADFGIARTLGATRITGTGLLVGTVAYLAPEQVRGEPVGPAVDVYALGLVLLEQLTGHREYTGPPAEAAVARLGRPPRVPACLAPGWGDLLTEMTALDPAARPGGDEVRDRLAAIAAGSPAPVLSAPVPSAPVLSAPVTSGPATAVTPILPPAVTPPVPPPADRAKHRGVRRRVRGLGPVLAGAGGVSAVVALLVGGAVALPLRGAPPRPPSSQVAHPASGPGTPVAATGDGGPSDGAPPDVRTDGRRPPPQAQGRDLPRTTSGTPAGRPAGDAVLAVSDRRQAAGAAPSEDEPAAPPGKGQQAGHAADAAAGPGRDPAGQGNAGQGNAGQGNAGEGNAGQGKAGTDRPRGQAGQDDGKGGTRGGGRGKGAASGLPVEVKAGPGG